MARAGCAGFQVESWSWNHNTGDGEAPLSCIPARFSLQFSKTPLLSCLQSTFRGPKPGKFPLNLSLEEQSSRGGEAQAAEQGQEKSTARVTRSAGAV